jgi:large subunit ribosomal protein L5
MEVKQMNRLKLLYVEQIAPSLFTKFNYKSTMQTPKLEKIVINMGVGDATVNTKFMDDAVKELTAIAGQKPVITKAKKSIATFKLREGMAIGCKVTLRGERMYDFLDKLINITLPRVRDFLGVSKNAFDGRGNYTLGIREQLIFPEIVYESVTKVRGMDIVVVTTAKSDEEAKELFRPAKAKTISTGRLLRLISPPTFSPDRLNEPSFTSTSIAINLCQRNGPTTASTVSRRTSITTTLSIRTKSRGTPATDMGLDRSSNSESKTKPR